jgi:hypothetical protein
MFVPRVHRYIWERLHLCAVPWSHVSGQHRHSTAPHGMDRATICSALTGNKSANVLVKRSEDNRALPHSKHHAIGMPHNL